eukprot:m.906289 g.906289  ORF g.906289 m.906289 type:complete len:1458 (-) comp23702_c1_seq2:144-4517(-)
MAVSSEPRVFEKRLLLGEGEIGPATVPRTRPASTNGISEAELADLNELRKTLSFQTDDHDQDVSTTPQQLPSGVSRDSETGAYRYMDSAGSLSAGGQEQMQKLRDIEALEAQLAYFQTMRRQAESLVEQLSAHEQDDDAADDMSQLEEKKLQLDMLHDQLQQIRQLQTATEQGDIEDDTSSTSVDMNEEDEDRGSGASEATVVPAVLDRAEEAVQLQNDLAELSKKRAILNGLRGKLDNLRNAASATMSNATDSTALPELQEKKEMLEMLQGQLAALRQLQQNNYDVEPPQSVPADNTERRDHSVDPDVEDHSAAHSADTPTVAALHQYASHPAVREKLQTLMQLQEKLESLRALQSSLEAQQEESSSALEHHNMDHSYNKIVEVTECDSDEDISGAVGDEGVESGGPDDAAAEAALVEKRKRLQLLEERLALLKQLQHASHPSQEQAGHEQSLDPHGGDFDNDFAEEDGSFAGNATAPNDTDATEAHRQLAELVAKREKLQDLHRKLVALKEAQRLQHLNETTAATTELDVYDYMEIDGSEEHYGEDVDANKLRAPTTVADTQLKELRQLERQLATMRALREEALHSHQAHGPTDRDAEEHLKDLHAKKALLEGLKGRLACILDVQDDDTGPRSQAPPLPTAAREGPRYDRYAQQERLQALRAKHGVPSLREEVLSHASTHGSQSTSEPNVSQISNGEDPVVRLQRLVDEVERQQSMIQRMSDMYIDDDDDDDSGGAPADNGRYQQPAATLSTVPVPSVPPALAPTLQVKDIDLIQARSQQQRRRQREVAFDSASVMRQYSNDESSQYGNDWTTATASVDLEETRAPGVLRGVPPHSTTDEETFGIKSNAMRMGGGGEDEAGLQNLKLAVLYSESLHVDRRESFLRTFFKFFSQPATAARAFQLSFDAYGPSTAHDDVPDSASLLLQNVRRTADNDSERAMNQFPDPDASIIANVDPSEDTRVAPLNADAPFVDYRWMEDQVERGNTDAPRPAAVPASPPRDGALFEELKDAIYREVAVFITCNESRPHFLLAFFRLAQCLTADHARGAAIDALQAVVGAYGATDDDADDSDDGMGLERFPPRIPHVRGAGGVRGTEDLDLIDERLAAAPEFQGGLDMSKYEVDVPYEYSHVTRRPGSAEHNNRSYDYEEMAEFVTDVPTDDDLLESNRQDAGGFGSAREGLAVQFQAEIEDNKDIILQLSRHLRELRSDGDSTAPTVFTEPVINTLASHVAASIQQRSGNASDGVEGAAQQVASAVRKSLQRYVGSSVADRTEDVLRDVSDILYDIMIFNKVIQQVDKSYLDEISELQTTRTDLDLEVDQLQKQREEDLAKLLRERRELLKKMKWDAERDSDRLDKKRDDEFAQACEFPDSADGVQDAHGESNVVVELTPSEAKLPGDSDDDGKPTNVSQHGEENTGARSASGVDQEAAAAAAALQFMNNNIMQSAENNLVSEDD